MRPIRALIAAVALSAGVVSLPAAAATADPTPPAAPGADRPDRTLALRDLAIRADNLPAAERRAAERELRRPTDKGQCRSKDEDACFADDATVKVQCTAAVCVHWTSTAAGVAPGEVPDPKNGVPAENDGPAGAFAGVEGNDLPDYVEVVLRELDHVVQTYLAAGYRPVLGDQGRGGNDLPDVYLAQIGDAGDYGYCTSDDPSVRSEKGHPTTWAYCVLDNDYSAAEYKANTPTQNIQVTATHEYFHAVQYAYDFNEDRWLLEATASWAEDEVYDDINDNLQYLSISPLRHPRQSLDSAEGQDRYGAWIFFRFLGERQPALSGTMPVVVREIWERAAGKPNARKAVSRTLHAHGTSLRAELGWFARWNRTPATYYSEGATYGRGAKLARSITLTANRSSGAVDLTNAELSAQSVRFRSAVKGKARLRVSLAVGSRASGGYALVAIKRDGQPVTVAKVPVGRNGRATVSYPFGAKVSWVELTLSNAGKRAHDARVSARVLR